MSFYNIVLLFLGLTSGLLPPQIFLVGDGILCFLPLFRLACLLLIAAYRVVTFADEVAECACDDHRVDIAIEPPVSTRFKEVEEQHHLGHLQEVVCCGDDKCQLFLLVLIEISCPCKQGQVDNLRYKPLCRESLSVGPVDLGQGGEVAHYCLLFVLCEVDLHSRAYLLQEAVAVTILTRYRYRPAVAVR